MSITKVAVTGGNGKLGSAILDHLGDHGYETVDIARGRRREDVSDEYVTADLLDAGEVYGAIAKSDADAVVHMGTIPHPRNHPGYRVYESNVLSAAHVLEASHSLGVQSVCLPSSINAIGSEHQERPVDVRYLPIDEDHPRTPDDSYGIAKHAMEVTADGVGRRPSTDLAIASLRLPWVPTESELREAFAEPDRSLGALHDAPSGTGEEVLFSYIHVEDAASIARHAIEADFGGHEAFWAVAPDTTADAPTTDVVEEFYPDVERRADLDGNTSLIDTSKATERLGWEPTRSWRQL